MASIPKNSVLVFQKLILLFAVFLGTLLQVPWGRVANTPDSIQALRVDLSFILTMPWLFKAKAQFGPEIVFTYGPFGFLASNVVPSEWFSVLIFIRVLLSIIFTCSFLHLAKNFGFTIKYLLLTFCFFLSIVGWEQYFWISFPVLALIYEIKNEQHAAMSSALALASALVSLIKFNFFIISAVCYLGILCGARPFKFEKLKSCVIFLVSLLSLWSLSGQSLYNFLPWIQSSLDLSKGYTQAMTKGFLEPYGWIEVLLMILAEMALIFLAFQKTCSSFISGYYRYFIFLPFPLAIFIFHRHAFGGNQIEQACAALVFMLFAILMLEGTQSIRFGKAIVFFVITSLLAVVLKNNFWLIVPAHQVPSKVLSLFLDSATFVSGRVPPASNFYSESLARLGEKFPELSKVEGTVDAIPDFGGLILGFKGAIYKPRPAYLSINAHTAQLLKRNERFFNSSHAPVNVLVETVPLEEQSYERFPASIDSLALASILKNYSFRLQEGGVMWLVRDYEGRPWSEPRIEKIDLSLGDSFLIPANKVVWMSMNVRQTFLGFLVENIYKMPRLAICYGAQKINCRTFLNASAEVGFFINPQVKTNRDWLDIQTALSRPRNSDSIETTEVSVIQLDGPTDLWNKKINVEVKIWDDSSLH